MEMGEFRKSVDGAIAGGDRRAAAQMLASAWSSEPAMPVPPCVSM